MTEALHFNADDLTVGDLNRFAEVAGMDFGDVLDKDGNFAMPKGGSHKVLLAMAFIAGRHQHGKGFTLEDAEDVKVTDLMSAAQEAPTPDPLPSGKASPKKRSVKPVSNPS